MKMYTGEFVVDKITGAGGTLLSPLHLDGAVHWRVRFERDGSVETLPEHELAVIHYNEDHPSNRLNFWHNERRY